MVTISAERRGIVGFLVVVAWKAGVTFGHLPCVRGMAAGAGKGGMFTFFVQTCEILVTRLTIHHRFDLCFLEVTFLAGH